jgi:hypothetical protein
MRSWFPILSPAALLIFSPRFWIIVWCLPLEEARNRKQEMEGEAS